MMKLTVAAAAFAAGMMTFAAAANEPPTRSAPQTSKLTGKTKDKDRAALKTVTAKTGKEFHGYPAGSITSLKKRVDTMKTGSIGGGFHDIISRYASSYGVPVSLAHAVIRVESNYRVDARGRAGEVGLMQIKPATARMMGYSGSIRGLFNPETNIKYGMKYLARAHQLGGGSTCQTILKYNAGHAAKRMNPISAAYCSKVKRHLGAT